MESNKSLATCETSATTTIIQIAYRAKMRIHQAMRNVLWLFPLLLAILIPYICITSYLLAIYNGHLEPLFPYVSDTGAIPSYAARFSQLIDISVILICITNFIRYKQVKYYIQMKLQEYSTEPKEPFEMLQLKLNVLNNVASTICYGGAFWGIVVGNYRTTESIFVHSAGAVMFFGGIMLYGIIMCYITYKLSQFNLESRPITMFAVIMLGFLSLLSIVINLFIVISLVGLKNYSNPKFRFNLNSSQLGHSLHVICTTLEWIMINCASLYSLCLFQRIRLFPEWDKVRF